MPTFLRKLPALVEKELSYGGIFRGTDGAVVGVWGLGECAGIAVSKHHYWMRASGNCGVLATVCPDFRQRQSHELREVAPGLLSLMVRVPGMVPVPPGENVTVIVQDIPVATLAPQSFDSE